MKMIKGLRIDPFKKLVVPVEVAQGDLAAIYAQLSTPFNKVECFDCVGLNATGDTVYVDDEGLLDWQAKQQEFFHVRWGNTVLPLAGRGLVLGTDDEGESVSTTLTIAQLEDMIQWGQ